MRKEGATRLRVTRKSYLSEYGRARGVFACRDDREGEKFFAHL